MLIPNISNMPLHSPTNNLSDDGINNDKYTNGLPYTDEAEQYLQARESAAFVAYLNSIARALLRGDEGGAGDDEDCDYVGEGVGNEEAQEKDAQDVDSTTGRSTRRKRRIMRRPLPAELVYNIFELACITNPYPEWVVEIPSGVIWCRTKAKTGSGSKSKYSEEHNALGSGPAGLDSCYTYTYTYTYANNNNGNNNNAEQNPNANLNPPISQLQQWTSPHPHAHHPSSIFPLSLPLPSPFPFPSAASASANLHPNANMNVHLNTNPATPTFVLRSTSFNQNQPSRQVWFVTPPLFSVDVGVGVASPGSEQQQRRAAGLAAAKRVCRAQLFTVSKDQGWVSNSRGGSWSWWEIGVVPSFPSRSHPDPLGSVDAGEGANANANANANTNTNDANNTHTNNNTSTDTDTDTDTNMAPLPPKSYPSHFNPLASRTLQPCTGAPFLAGHPIWDDLREAAARAAAAAGRCQPARARSFGSGSSSTSRSTSNSLDLPSAQRHPTEPSPSNAESESGSESGLDCCCGPRLAVVGCARFPGWMCVASVGRLVVWSAFAPDL